MLKAVNFLRTLSALFFMAVFVVVYAYMPVMVKLIPGDTSFLLHKEYFFYYGAGIFLLINILGTILLKLTTTSILQRKGEETTAWFSSLPLVLNIYMTLLAGFLGVLNNPGSIPTSNYAYLNFLGPLLIFVWFFGLMYFIIKGKRTT